jgi:hypothetical protein
MVKNKTDATTIGAAMVMTVGTSLINLTYEFSRGEIKTK